MVVIHHERAPIECEQSYLLSILARRWERNGIRVRHLYGTAELAPADLAILHVDLSVVPRSYAAFARRYPAALNAATLDIRKRRVSTLTLRRPGAYRGPVIVKTDLNAAGAPERLLRRRRESPPITIARRVAARLARFLHPAPRERIVDAFDYAVYRTATEVPRRYFRSRRLVVERFVPERRGRYFCHRRYYFLGRAEVNQVWLGTLPVCAGDEDCELVESPPTPPELRAFRRRFRIEYGKIDYVLGRSGEVVVFDVNKTPWGECPDPADEPWLEDLCRGLLPGIEDLVPGSASPPGTSGRAVGVAARGT